MAMLRLATFNLLHGMALTDGASDPDRLKTAVHEVDADILALQEVDHAQPRSGGADQTALAAAATGARWHRFVPTVLGTPGVRGWTAATSDADPGGEHAAATGNDPSFGISLVSRLPVREWHVRRFGAAPGRLPLVVPTRGRPQLLVVPDEPRVALAAVVDGPHGPFTVVATHLSFVPGFNLRQLRAIVRGVEGMPRPAFLLGDLNLPGGLPARVSGWTSLVSARTYPSFGPRVQLDHVLADGAGRHDVHSEHVWTLPVSDHCAIGVDVEV